MLYKTDLLSFVQGKVSIRVTPDSMGRHVILQIQDTGCGIPKADLAHLLVPFKQVWNIGHSKDFMRPSNVEVICSTSAFDRWT